MPKEEKEAKKTNFLDGQHLTVYLALFSFFVSGFSCLYVWKLDKQTFETYRIEQRSDFKEVKTILTRTREDLIQIKAKLHVGKTDEQ